MTPALPLAGARKKHMPAFAANLTMNYTEFAFLDRFGAAARDGFRGVEFLFPYDFPAAEIRNRLESLGLRQALFNAPPGDWAKGERGLASIPGREDDFRRSVDMALDYTRHLGNSRLHVMAGLCTDAAERPRHRDVYRRNIAFAAEQARASDVTIVLEAINTRDMPGYFLNYQEDAADICAEIGSPNVQVQFDLYHAQIMQGDLTRRLETLIGHIGHIQAASVPERHEPDDGEVAFPFLFARLDSLGYEGWVGCEYRPRTRTSDGLAWLAPWKGRTALRP
jgi:2-dehydrotetronate isomerase